jgi:hypothetical protein
MIRNFGVVILVAMSLAVLFGACKSDSTTGPAAGQGEVNGTVSDAVTGGTLGGVTVTGQSIAAGTQVAVTGTDGKFALTFTIDSSATVTLVCRKSGYRDTTVVVNVRAGNIVGPLQLRLVSSLPQGPAVINGLIKDLLSGASIVGAQVISSSSVLDPASAISDASGKFLLTFPIDSSLKGSSAPVNLQIKVNGYRDTIVAASVQFGVVTPMTIRLLPKTASLVTGNVTDATTHAPLSAVTVLGTVVTGGTGSQSSASDLLGDYQIGFAIDSSVIVRLDFSKIGFRDTSIFVRLKPSSATAVDARLSHGFTGGGGGSGLAQTIAFLGADPEEVSVFGVGGKETSVLSWEVRDSLGQPIDGDHAVDLTFQILNGPGGGEYISPVTVETANDGRAATTLNAGTRSGVIMVAASATVGSRTITSGPVRMTINGGFAVQERFSVGASKFNFPALGWLGRSIAITVLAGDAYSNPVAKGTAVYFRTSAGVVQASAFTDNSGQGSVTLFSGNPEPFGAYSSTQGNGYHYVVAETRGQGGLSVRDSVLVMWSGYPVISNINPQTFVLDSARGQDFTFTVSDQLGHPLAAGTTISVTARVPPPPSPDTPVKQVNLAFGNNGALTLLDVLFPGPGTTDFTFRVSDGAAGIHTPTPVVVTISVTGPNGTAQTSITGIVQ